MISNSIKCRILVCVLFIEAVFSGYVPANAACISDNTIISENSVAENEAMPEIQVTEEKGAGPFAGANGETGDLQWNITEHGHLTISGTGDYNDVFVNYVKMPPWCEYADYIYTANT